MKNNPTAGMTRNQKIEYYTYVSNDISISNRNQKTGPLCNDLAMPTCTCRKSATKSIIEEKNKIVETYKGFAGV